MDFPTAWKLVKKTKLEAHDPKCSYRQMDGALLCDCHVLKELERVAMFDYLCSKSKKICYSCLQPFRKPTKEEMKDRRIFCSWVSFEHPTKKSKSYRLCGDCYGELLRRKEEK